MKFKTALICRGEGKVFFHLKAEKGFSFTNARYSVKSDSCGHIPVTAYTYQSSSFAIHEVVVTIPQLYFKKVTLTVQCGNEIASQSFTRSTIIAQSKLAYGLKAAHANAVRNIATNMPTQGIRIAPVSFSEAKEKNPVELIFKGTITVPEDSAIIHLYITDNTGNNKKAISCSLMQTFTENGIPLSAYSFTHRFIENPESGCLVVTCDNPSIQDAFFSLDSANIRESLEKYTTEGYLCAKRGHYDLFREAANARRRISAQNISIDYGTAPLFSIVTPLYNTPLPFLEEMLRSLTCQTYNKWELILVNASPNNAELTARLSELADPRITTITLEANLGIAENTNRGIEQASGDFVCFLDHDDTLEPEALFVYWQYLSSHPQTDALYCDEDLLDESGHYIDPNFKPDFSLDLLRAHNYVTHFLAIRKTIATRLKLNSCFDGAQDYDLVLRLSEATSKIAHIPEVLYHWRISDSSTAKNSSSKTYAIEAGRNALAAHLDRCNIPAQISTTAIPFFYHVAYKIKGSPLVSIVIPNKDHVKILEQCLNSIQEKSTYRNFEIIVIENNSSESETFDYYQTIQTQWNNVTVVTWHDSFNYSKINNFGVQSSNGEYIVLLNNDTEVINPHWIEAMLGYCQQEHVGAVGAKLLFPDNTIQHAGIKIYECKTPAESGGPVHIFQHLDKDEPGYMRRLVNPHNVNVVTAACLMTRKSLYEQVGGLDEAFAVAYNDVDFCLTLRQLNYRIVYNPEVLLYHHESISRGSDTSSSGLANYARFLSEQGLFRQKWSKILTEKDSFHAFG